MTIVKAYDYPSFQHLMECSECGHLHYEPALTAYYACPIDECPCPWAKGEVS